VTGTDLPTAPARVAAVVLNYRTPELVIDCLETLAPEIDPQRDCIVVVDNQSGDDSAGAIRNAVESAGWKSVQVVESPRNGGFAAGNNYGIAAVDAQAYLLLNSDTLIRPGAVETLWRALQARTDVGLVSPRLEWPDGAPQISTFRFHSPFSELVAGSGTGAVRSLLERWDVPIPVREEAFSPEWTSFAAVMIRAEVLRVAGPLDDGFFMYFEDVDYCRRARRAGWRVWHEPEARVVHLRGGTSSVKAATAARRRRPDYYYASRRRYFRNAYGAAGPVLANLCWTLGRVVSWLRETLGSKPPHTVDRELQDNWTG